MSSSPMRFPPPSFAEAMTAAGAALRLGAPPEIGRFTGASADTRRLSPGMVFVALKGAKFDGIELLAEAAARGAVAAVASLEGAARAFAQGEPPLPIYVAADPRRAAARLAAMSFREAQPRVLVAVTGTSGKSSTVEFLRQIWGGLGRKAAALGTVGTAVANLPAELADEGGLTTPDPETLHRILARFAEAGAERFAFEASSHGLDQRRLDGARLAGGALTNVARDHMDYHPTPENYLAAKLRLFAELLPPGSPAVVNADDPSGLLAFRVIEARRLRALPVGFAAAAETGIRILEAKPEAAGLRLRFRHAGRDHQTRLGLVGGFQARNVLTAAALAIGTGESPEKVFALLEGLKGVRGRMEPVASTPNGAQIYVDYAHKPDAVAAALAALRPHTPGRIHVAIGAGGDRDTGKRPLMGAAAAQGADVVIVTDDNPRSEDPALIRAAILAAAPGAREIGDRAEAIRAAVAALGPGDSLLIAGKGHETGQIVKGVTTHFDDAEEARKAVSELTGEGA